MAKTLSTSLELACASGLALVAVGLVLAFPSRAQETVQAVAATCPAGGFDPCFPDLDAGAPGAACDEAEEGAAEISACLGNLCSSEAAEPQPGFFSYCCGRGGSTRYDDFCVFVVQTACPAVAEHCADRCPPLELLTGTVPLAPPPAACLESYPPFVSAVCAADSFCCETSWDEICAAAALEASGD